MDTPSSSPLPPTQQISVILVVVTAKDHWLCTTLQQQGLFDSLHNLSLGPVGMVEFITLNSTNDFIEAGEVFSLQQSFPRIVCMLPETFEVCGGGHYKVAPHCSFYNHTYLPNGKLAPYADFFPINLKYLQDFCDRFVSSREGLPPPKDANRIESMEFALASPLEQAKMLSRREQDTKYTLASPPEQDTKYTLASPPEQDTEPLVFYRSLHLSKIEASA